MIRILDTVHPQPATVWYLNRSIGIKILSVETDGMTVPYTRDDSNGILTVKIGDVNRTIIGLHHYKLDYQLSGALFYGPSGSAFYYNVTGNDWQVPINHISVIVSAASESLLTDKSDCYFGTIGVTTHCTVRNKNSNRIEFSASGITPGSGLTVAQAINSDTVAKLMHEQFAY